MVAATADLLWRPIGSGPLRYLRNRGFLDGVLAANRVGFDPGPRHLARPRGFPYRGPGIVFPALEGHGRAIYYQLRYLDPARAGRKYDQPLAEIAPNPRVVSLVAAGPSPPGFLTVCEGYPDGLTAAHTDVDTAAVLGVGHASPDGADQLAAALLERYPNTGFAICFDADERTRPDKAATGRIAANRLAVRLAVRGALVARISPAPPHKDLNDWWRAEPDAVRRDLHGTCAVLADLQPSPPSLAVPPTEMTL
jgi:hypothetical protein